MRKHHDKSACHFNTVRLSLAEKKGYSGIRQNGFQEMDIVSMTRHITKLSVTPMSAVGFPDIVTRAYNMAMLGRKGGVIIDFPYNIQKTEVEL